MTKKSNLMSMEEIFSLMEGKKIVESDFERKIEVLEECIHIYEEEELVVKNLEQEINDINITKNDLYHQFHHKYGMINNAESRHYTMEEIIEARKELADTSWKTLIKRLFFGRRADEIYGDLMGKLIGLLDYLQSELNQQEEKVKKALAQMLKAASDYEFNYMQIQKEAGCTPDTNWKEFIAPKVVTGDLYLGDIDIALDVEINYSISYLQEAMPNSFFEGCIRQPYTRSLKIPFHFLYEYGRNRQQEAVKSVRSLIYQIIRMTPNDYIEMHFMDGKSAGNTFSELMGLEKVVKTNVNSFNRRVTGGTYRMAKLYRDEHSITEGLQHLEEYMLKATSEMSLYESIEIYNAKNNTKEGRGFIPYQLIIIQNFPVGFNENDIRILDTLIRNGSKAGISVLVLNNRDEWEQFRNYNSTNVTLQDKMTRESLLQLDSITFDDYKINLTASDYTTTFRLQLMHNGQAEYIQIVQNVKNKPPEVAYLFSDAFNIHSEFGTLKDTEGLHIPFAIDSSGDLIEYYLGTALNAHGLICGGTGSGKSSLLHMLISSIVMNYKPQDVEIWLADYKITEFYSYKTNTPPHIRFIGLSKTSDFSYAFLNKIIHEMSRRQDLIARTDAKLKDMNVERNVTSFNDYHEIYDNESFRKKYRLTEQLTRLVVIVDEFHVMAQHAQNDPDYKLKLENILSEARAFGIILLLSDQAIVDGLRGLSDKGKKQIRARLALSNYEDELKEALNEKDSEEIKKFLRMKVGEVAVQTMYEERDEDGILREKVKNEIVHCVYIRSAERFQVCKKARQIYQAEEYVADVFDDRDVEEINMVKIQNWESECLVQHRDGSKDLQIYLGRPLNLDFSMHFSLLQRKGNNIMSVSGTEEQQMRILTSVLASFRRQKNYEIVVLADPFAGLYREYSMDICQLRPSIGNMSVYDDLSNICYQINRLLGIMENRGNQKKTLVVWLGLDSMADLMSEGNNRKSEILRRLSKPNSKEEEKRMSTATSSMNSFESMFDEIFLDDENEEDRYAENSNETITYDLNENYLYDAREDITRLVHYGPSRNIYHMVFYDTAASLRDFRGIKNDDFVHKIAFSMSENEAADFLEKSSLIRSMPEHMAFYYNGRSGKKFIPYKF